MGSVRLYFVRDSPCDENKQPYYIGSVAAPVDEDRAFHCTPGWRYQISAGAVSIVVGKHLQHQNDLFYIIMQAGVKSSEG